MREMTDIEEITTKQLVKELKEGATMSMVNKNERISREISKILEAEDLTYIEITAVLENLKMCYLASMIEEKLRLKIESKDLIFR